jgi:hypothetical protein
VTLNDYRECYSWQEAMELGRPLTKLTEDLPAQEERGLISSLQGLMIELPATIAVDLITNTNSRLAVILRMQAALELIERVYPALDTAEPKTALERLIERCESPAFNEVHVPPAPVEEVDEDEDPAPAPTVEVATESV